MTKIALVTGASRGLGKNIACKLAKSGLDVLITYHSRKKEAMQVAKEIETLTRCQAKELGSRGIRVNAVAPGPIATDFAGGVIRDNAQYNGYIKKHTALGRVGEPEDIGGVVAFLCTEDARWITAQRIEVSGGMHL